jgi:putative hydrolase of the HAD superfamily
MNKALFWDFDGTLVHSNHLWSKSVHKVLKQNINNCNISLEQIRPHLKTGFTWHTPNEDFSNLKDDLWWDFMFKRFSLIYNKLGVEKNLADRLSLMVRDNILDINNYTIYQDTVDTLEACTKMGYKNYILSNNYPELFETIKKLNISEYFSDYIISAKIGYDKPRREIFEYAIKQSENPTKCFMIGDNPIADIEGATNIGIPSLLVHNNTVSKATYSIDNLNQIIDIL